MSQVALLCLLRKNISYGGIKDKPESLGMVPSGLLFVLTEQVISVIYRIIIRLSFTHCENCYFLAFCYRHFLSPDPDRFIRNLNVVCLLGVFLGRED